MITAVSKTKQFLNKLIFIGSSLLGIKKDFILLNVQREAFTKCRKQQFSSEIIFSLKYKFNSGSKF